MDLPNINKLWYDSKAAKRRKWPQNNFWASNLGNPCDRFHYYGRENWEDKEMHAPKLQSIFDEGNLHEDHVIASMKDMGLEVVEQQVPGRISKPHIKQGTIAMKIDGKIKWRDDDGKTIKIPFDVKTMSPHIFSKMNTAEDFMHSHKQYHKNYVAQLQLYMLSHNSEIGLLVLKDKLTGELKGVWMQIDYAFCETLLKRAERVEGMIQSKTLPSRHENLDVCLDCPFARTVCLPDLKLGEGIQAIDDKELEIMLEERDKLEPSKVRYAELDKRVKELATSGGPGEKICGDFVIRVKEYERKTKVPLTWDEKITTFLKTQIGRITNG